MDKAKKETVAEPKAQPASCRVARSAMLLHTAFCFPRPAGTLLRFKRRHNRRLNKEKQPRAKAGGAKPEPDLPAPMDNSEKGWYPHRKR